MSLIVTLLGALRAALRTRTDLALENLALRSNSPCSAVARRDRGSDASIALSGCASLAVGQGGARRSMSFAPRQ